MNKMLNRFFKANFLGLMLIASFGVSCSKQATQILPPSAASNVLAIGGGAVSIAAQDLPIQLNSQEILDDTDTPVKDGTLFIVTGSDNIPVSLDGINFSKSIKVASKKAVINFSARPSTVAGTYKIQVVQNQKQSRNAIGTFYVDVTPTIADDLGKIVTDRVETIPPPSIHYSALADGVTAAQVSVGPIIDKYGNSLNKGYIRLVADKGQIVSTNPVTISDGYALFSFIPTEQESTVNIKAQAVDEAAAVIIKEEIGTIYQVKPKLQFSSDEDLGNFILGQTASITTTLKNVGSTVANNIKFSTTLPFSIPSIDSQCPANLNVGESCSFTIQANSTTRANIVGSIIAQADVTTIPEAKATLGLTARAVDSAHLSVSNSTLGFNSVCAKTVDQIINVQNPGELDATNFSVVDTYPMNQDVEVACNSLAASASCLTNSLCRWTASSVCTSKAFDVIIPAADAVITGPTANCGKTIPAGGINCRLIVRFFPMSLYSNYQTSFRIQADGVAPVAVNLNASSGIGDPAVQIPISFTRSEIGLSQSDTSGITLGPVVDQCGNKLNNLSTYSASVTAGALTPQSGVFTNGGATLNWNGSNLLQDMGPQTFKVTAGSISNQASLPFTGVKISLASNPTNIAEVNFDSPDYKTWIVQNSGNKQTSISNIDFTNLQNVTVQSSDISGCAILPANGTCTVRVLFKPVITADPASVQFSGNLSVLSPGRGQNSDSIQFLGFSSRTINIGNNDSQFYYLGQAPAGVGSTKTITVRNNSAIAMSALTYSITGPTANWSYTTGTCGVTLNSGDTCTFKMNYSSADLTAGNKQTTMRISSGVRYSDLTFSLDLIGDINNINSTIPMATTNQSISADGVSTTTVTAGVVTDLLNNEIQPGTPIYFSTTKGTIVEAQPMYLGVDGKATVTIKSKNNQVGNSSVEADLKNAQGTVIASGYKTIQFTGVYITFGGVSDPVEFGNVPLGQFKDIHLTLKNSGTANASNLSIVTSNVDLFSLADLGTCAIGSLSAGQSCDIVVRYNSNSLAGSQGVTSILTASTSENTGQNSAKLNLHAVSLLPATLASSLKTLAIPLTPGSIYTTQVTLTNIGADTLRNFTLLSNKPNNLILSSYDACNNLAGGASCQFTLTFNAIGLTSLFSSIITAAGDNTSFQINFIADTVNLAFINPNFNDDAFTCQPVQIQTQDSNSNAMTILTNLTLSISSSKLGSFYGNRSCSGTSLSRVVIPQGGSTSTQLYYQPKVAGKHILTASADIISATQENLANIVVSPGKNVRASPRQPIPFTALGAQVTVLGVKGNIHCSFVLNSSGSTSPIPAVGQTCNYTAGNLGSVVDRLILTDSDSPPNTVAIQISIGPSISISPVGMTVNSGDQIQFSATGGSNVGYTYSTEPNNPHLKIGSSVYSNIYTAGQNITNNLIETDPLKDFYVESVTAKDSYGASSTTLVKVKKSIFKQQQVISAPTTGSKTVAMWGNLMLVGDPAAMNLTNLQGAGAVHVYQKDLSVANKTGWTFLSTIYSPLPEINGSFGQSIAIWNNQVVVGAPKEAGTIDAAESGVIYHFSIDSTGATSPMTRIFSKYTKVLTAYDHFGEIVSITKQFLTGYNPISHEVAIYDYTNFTQNPSNCNNDGYHLCPDQELNTNGATALSIYSDDNYGGAYLAIGSAEDSIGSVKGGAVRVYKRSLDTAPGGVWSNPDQTVLPETAANLSPGALLGASVAMYGPYLVVGSPGYNNGKGQVFIFHRDPNLEDNTWSVEYIIKPETYNPYINQGANFGKSLAYFGNYVLIGAPGEVNYPGLANSGSAYAFQRYLSDNNRWEFLGQLRSTDYSANDNFSSSMAVYTNDFAITSFSNNTGLVSTFNGGKSINNWPFGFHGIKTLSENYEQPAGKMRDWAALIVPAQYRYIIKPKMNSFSYIGVAGDIVLNGVIQSTGSSLNGTVTGQKPDESGYILGEQMSINILQSAGGYGGRGNPGRGQSWFPSITDGNNIGTGIIQFGAATGQSGLCYSYNITGYNGRGDYSVSSGTGGNGGVGVSGSMRPSGNDDGGGRRSSGSSGGGGGRAGDSGVPLLLNIQGQISGTGFVDISGQNGKDGDLGADTILDQIDQSSGGENGGVQQFIQSHGCGGGDGNKYTIHSEALGGVGGQGGGGAGGSAASFELVTPDHRQTSPFNIFAGGGNGGGSSPDGQRGYHGTYGCWMINGNTNCGDIVLKDVSDITFEPGKTYTLTPSGGSLNLNSDQGYIVRSDVGYYVDNGNNINQTCVWKFTSVNIPAGVTINIDPACKWTQILAKDNFILNGTINANGISDGNSTSYQSVEMAFSGQFLTNNYQANIIQTNGGSGGLSYENTAQMYDYSGQVPTPSYNYVNHAGPQANGNGGVGSSVGSGVVGGGGSRGSSGQNIFIKSPTGIIGNGTINVSGSNGNAGGNSYSETVVLYDNAGNLSYYDNITLDPSLYPQAINGGGGGGAGGSGGTIIVKTPSNPANINFLYVRGQGGQGGKSVVHSTKVVYANDSDGSNSSSTSTYNDSNTAGNAGADGANGVYNFISTTNFK